MDFIGWPHNWGIIVSVCSLESNYQDRVLLRTDLLTLPLLKKKIYICTVQDNNVILYIRNSQFGNHPKSKIYLPLFSDRLRWVLLLVWNFWLLYVHKVLELKFGIPTVWLKQKLTTDIYIWSTKVIYIVKPCYFKLSNVYSLHKSSK